MKNLDIRMAIREKRLHHYEVAARIGISEYTLCRWLREDLTEERKDSILKAISEIIGGEQR